MPRWWHGALVAVALEAICLLQAEAGDGEGPPPTFEPTANSESTTAAPTSAITGPPPTSAAPTFYDPYSDDNALPGFPTTIAPTSGPPSTLPPTNTLAPTTSSPTTLSPTSASPTSSTPTSSPTSGGCFIVEDSDTTTTAAPTSSVITEPPPTFEISGAPTGYVDPYGYSDDNALPGFPTTIAPTSGAPATLPPTNSLAPTTSSPTTLSPTSASPTSSSPTSSPTGSGNSTGESGITQGLCGVGAVCSGIGLNSICTCPSGYGGESPASEGCSDVNECALGGVCSTPHSVCANTLGSFTCSCAVGFTGGGTVSSPCVDVDECAPAEPGLVPCSGAHETCTNTPGSFLCGCGSGYASAHDGCTNVDECAERDGTVACPANNTQCTDTEGSFSCSCSAGYELPLGYALVDGTIPGGAFGGAEGLGCVDVDECAVSQGLCVRREDCRNTAGSWYCCTDNHMGLTAALAEGQWHGATTCAELIATECGQDTSIGHVVTWYCAKSCQACVDHRGEQPPTLSAPPTSSPTATTHAPTAAPVPSIPAVLRLHLVGDGVSIDGDVETPVIQRLAAEAGIAPSRVVPGTFIARVGRLEVFISTTSNYLFLSATEARQILVDALSEGPLYFDHREGTVEIHLDVSRNLNDDADPKRSSSSGSTSNASAAVIVIAAACVLFLSVGAVLAWRQKRQREARELEVLKGLEMAGRLADGGRSTASLGLSPSPDGLVLPEVIGSSGPGVAVSPYRNGARYHAGHPSPARFPQGQLAFTNPMYNVPTSVSSDPYNSGRSSHGGGSRASMYSPTNEYYAPVYVGDAQYNNRNV